MKFDKNIRNITNAFFTTEPNTNLSEVKVKEKVKVKTKVAYLSSNLDVGPWVSFFEDELNAKRDRRRT